jgi:NAD(P)-dependent dehydrogenase (short-subunit alcohol dehydrogenase family)
MDLTDQHIVLMGGSSGIGLATARMLVEAGAQVVVTGRNREKLDTALAQLGKRATGAIVDATSLSDLRTFFRANGPFQHLVIAVSGAAGAGSFRQLDLAELRRGYEAKFWAHMAIAQTSLDTLQSDGSLTFITAGAARVALPGTAGLAAINGALNAMVPTLALELRPLRVNGVCPGVIMTPWWDHVPEQARNAIFAQAAASVPVRRVGQPEDVAQAILFLIQDSFVTGTIIDCDGGAHLK